MFDFVEPRVRRVVAEQLGVNADELAEDVSLTDDLAADSLDLLELALALEGELGIAIPESTLDEVRTFGDLLGAAHALTRRRRAAEAIDAAARPEPVWARVVSPRAPGGDIQRAGWLTPYTAETIAEDAIRAGRGARLEVAVPSSLSDERLAQLQDEFSWLGSRGVQVSVRRDQHLGPIGQRIRPHAAAGRAPPDSGGPPLPARFRAGKRGKRAPPARAR
jgi:acyl carrier protein